MNFRPRSASRRLWDTWFYDHDGTYYLYYLSNPVTDDGVHHPWDAFSLAISRDLLHWEEKGEVFYKSSNPADWDSEIITTGDIIAFAGRYWMTYRATQDRVEKNNIIVSDDLLHWERISATPVFTTAPPYEHDPAQTVNRYVEMRDVTIAQRPDGVLEALFTARIDRGPHAGRGVIGAATSRDMRVWEAGEPVFAPGRFNVIEVPSRFRHGDREYLLYCVNRHLESEVDSPRYPRMTWCTAYAVSGGPGQPFEWEPDRVLLTGDAYVGRLVRAGGETLFLHHLCSARPAFAFPKSVAFQPDGSITLGCWSGIDALAHGEPATGFAGLDCAPAGLPACAATVDGDACTLESHGGYGDAYLPGSRGAFVLDVEIDYRDCDAAGLLLRADPAARSAIMLTLRRDRGILQIGTSKATYSQLAPNDVRHEYLHETLKSGRVALRVVARSEGCDWYIDGALVFTTVDEGHLAGATGLFVRQGAARFAGLRIQALEEEPGFAL